MTLTRTPEPCPACRQPILYHEEERAVRIDGRVREFHAACRDAARPSDLREAVGRRLEAIFDQGKSDR